MYFLIIVPASIHYCCALPDLNFRGSFRVCCPLNIYKSLADEGGGHLVVVVLEAIANVTTLINHHKISFIASCD